MDFHNTHVELADAQIKQYLLIKGISCFLRAPEDFGTAQNHLRKGVQLSEQVYGFTHELTRRALRNLGKVYNW